MDSPREIHNKKRILKIRRFMRFPFLQIYVCFQVFIRNLISQLVLSFYKNPLKLEKTTPLKKLQYLWTFLLFSFLKEVCCPKFDAE